jgi:predicted  nucleic acid-binding Zn-ribbon protein
MALGTELFNLATSYDPYGAFKEGQMAPQKYDLEQQKLDVQQQAMKEAQSDLSGQAKPQGTQPLAGMAKSMLPPGFELETSDGIPTSSGLYNKQMINSQQDMVESQRMMKQATLARAMGDDKSYGDLVNKAKLLQRESTQNMANAKKDYQKSIDDGLESLYFAKPGQYSQNLKDALDKTGIPLPKDIPQTWSPEVKEKLISKMSPETRAKVAKEERAREDQELQRKAAARAEHMLVIADRREARIEENERKQYGGLGATSFLNKSIGTSAKDEKVNQSIVDTALGVNQMDEVINKFKDPEVKTGVVAKLTGIKSKLASLGDDNKEITPEDFKRIVDGEISPTAKNAVAQKEALFAAYTAEREIAGGRLLVSVIKQAGGALDPTAYEKEGYLNLLSGRRSELVKRLRGKGLNNQQIDTVIKDINQPDAPVEKQFEKPRQQNSAPQAALDYLKSNPSQKEAFKAKYGYLPEGY